ncbi:hypothetical protein ABT133_29365 [Streptomyces sp. NPDC001835]|uniref:hypothetical protein n=1 Tax=Streptomyces sp. NPDC001835 TaxID=3154528 RepID=UPI0033211FAD
MTTPSQTTGTTQTTGHAPAAGTGTHHFVLTLQAPAGDGFLMHTFTGPITPPAGWTRAELLTELRDQIADNHPDYQGAHIVFWSLEPNAL